MEESWNENRIIDLNSSDDILSVLPIDCEEEGVRNEVVVAGDHGKEIVPSNPRVEPPYVGQTFCTCEEAEAYYEEYAKQEGFGIVKGSLSYRTKGGQRTNELRCVTWRCDCYGKPDRRRKVNGQRITPKDLPSPNVKRSSKKCGCPASMHVVVDNSKQWVVKKVELEHQNHTPSPSKTRHIAMFRRQELNCHVVKTVLDSHAAGVPIPQIHKTLAIERNGFDNLALTERDLRNVVDKSRRLKMEGGDSNAMMRYLRWMNGENPNFHYTVRLDDEGNLKDVMWVDARCRAAYEEFGDVVCFDATYMTNKFELPFVNFVGTNHHGQTTLFGCALLSHEDVETYSWLFTTWLACMKGKAPGGILTDQDAAMRKALQLSMPQSRHRWCIWHILSKLKSKLGTVENYKEFKTDLKRAIYESMTTEEFETNWNSVIMAYKQENNEWLSGLYDERHMWIPAYMKHMFWAGMKTTQRSESIHRFFDGYVNSTTKMFEFPEKYCFALEVRANEEKEADSKSWRRTRKLITEFKVESTFLDLYTDAKFLEVQVECQRCLYVTPLERRDVGEDVVEHIFEDKVYVTCPKTKKQISTNRMCNYSVWFNKTTHDSGCECKLFECRGIMCRHLIMAFYMHKVQVVPDKFILRRWRKDIPRKHRVIKVAYHDATKTEEVKRFDKLMVAFQEVCLKASQLEENVDVCMELIQLMDIRVQENNNKVRHQQLGLTEEANQSSVRSCNKDGNVPTQPILGTPEATSINNMAYHFSSGGRSVPYLGDLSHGNTCARTSETEGDGDLGGGESNNEVMSIGDPKSRRTKGEKRQTERFKSVIEKAVNASKKKKATKGPPSQVCTDVVMPVAHQSLTPQPIKSQTSGNNKDSHLLLSHQLQQQSQQQSFTPPVVHRPCEPQSNIGHLIRMQQPSDGLGIQPQQVQFNPGQQFDHPQCYPSTSNARAPVSRRLFPTHLELPWDFRGNCATRPNPNTNDLVSPQPYPTLNNGAYSISQFEELGGSTSARIACLQNTVNLANTAVQVPNPNGRGRTTAEGGRNVGLIDEYMQDQSLR